MFNILRDCQTVFRSGCAILHFQKQRMKVPIFLHPPQCLLLSFFFLICLRQVLVVARGISRCSTWFSSCGSQALYSWRAASVVAACGLSSCDAWAPERTDSVVAVRGLSCPTACGILVPQPGTEPVFLALEGRFLTTGPPG